MAAPDLLSEIILLGDCNFSGAQKALSIESLFLIKETVEDQVLCICYCLFVVLNLCNITTNLAHPDVSSPL